MHPTVAIAAVLALALPARAQDWPEFRGGAAQGVSRETHLPVEWSATKNVAWKRAVPGHGWSSPVIHAGRLFVHFGHQGTAALDLDGRVLWRFQPPKYDPEDGNGGSPIVVDDILYFTCDGKDIQFVLALDRETGKLLWRTDRPSPAKNGYSYCTPLLLTADGRKQIVSPASGAVRSYDPKNGGEIWRIDTGEGYSVVPRPVYGHGFVYVCTGFDRPNLLAIRPDGRGNVTTTHVAWSAKAGVPLVASVVLAGDELYRVSDIGLASCLDAKTGAVHWSERLGAQHWSSPIFADGRIYFQDAKGIGVVVRAGTRFELLARNALEEPTHASYAVSDGALFIRTEKHLYRIQNRRD